MSIAQTPYTIVMLLTVTPAWLSLSRANRNSFNETEVNPLLSKYADRVQVRLFDAEAFTTRCSDFGIFTTHDLKAYYFLIEELRDTLMFTIPYFIMNEVVIGLENGYQDFEGAQKVE